MMGAICGDVSGSIYEWCNIKHKPERGSLVLGDEHVTDDSVMTCAVACGIREGLLSVPKWWMYSKKHQNKIKECIRVSAIDYGKTYPRAGYGSTFFMWLTSSEYKPYQSLGNGSAMRVSYAGWVARSLREAEKLAEISAAITHDHPEGIKGAKAVAGCIFLLRSGKGKEDILRYASKYYDLSFTLDEIRPTYKFNATCPGSVPQAIKAFLEGEDFEDVLDCAISIGGDSDTIAAIAGSIAEVMYPIPEDLLSRVKKRMDLYLSSTISKAAKFAREII